MRIEDEGIGDRVFNLSEHANLNERASCKLSMRRSRHIMHGNSGIPALLEVPVVLVDTGYTTSGLVPAPGRRRGIGTRIVVDV